MPATHTRSNAFTPPPNSAETGIMPDLYRLSVGPLHAAYYQQQFQRFEALGKSIPSWNSAAAFFTLAWMVLRKQWRPAGLYALAWAVLAIAWAKGLHARVPLQVEATVCLLALLLLCAVPGFLANGWYYQQVRSHTLDTLTRARSIGQARAQLAEGGIDRQRLYLVAAAQGAISLALAALLYTGMHHAPTPSTASTRTPAPAGPPNLVIPSVASVQALPSPPLMETALPESMDTPAAAVHTPEAGDAPSLPASAPTFEAMAEAETTATPAELTPAAAPAAMANAEPPAIAARPNAPTQPAKRSVTPPKAEPPATATANKAAKTPSPAVASSATTTGGLIAGKYYLNAGVYAQSGNADRAVQQLQAAKLHTLRQTVSGKQGSLTRLRIGPFDTRQQAEQAAATARKLRIESSVFQQPSK